MKIVIPFLLFIPFISVGVVRGEEPPNIIIILADDLGYGDLSCFGQTAYSTPNLDQIAEEGIKFTNFYVSQPICSASRASLMTSCYANRVGIAGALMPTDSIGLHPDEMTIAELVKQKNYATAIYGKWHLGHLPTFLPTQQGFDDYFGIPYSNDMWPSHPKNDHFNFPELPILEDEKVYRYLTDDQDSLTIWYTERAVDFINQNRKEPFFLYLAHSMPHVPLFVSDNFRGRSGVGLYADVVQELDWSVGQVMQALKRNGLEDNTLVIFTSDNGPSLHYGAHAGSAGPLREGKGTVFEGGVRVPFVAKWPAKIPAGIVQSLPAATIDIFPTIAHWIGAELPDKNIDGKDVSSLFSNKTGSENPHAAYFFYFKKNELQGMLSGDGRWKMYFPHKYRSLEERKGRNDGKPILYNYHTETPLSLYDLENDVSEKNNIVHQRNGQAERMKNHADSIRLVLGDALKEKVGKERRKAGLHTSTQ